MGLSLAGDRVREANFSDSDEAAAAIRSTKIEFSVLDAPRGPWRVGEADLASCSLWWGRIGAHSAGTGAMRDTAWLVMAANDAHGWAVNRLALGACNVVFVPEAADYAVRYSMPGSWFSIAFSRDWLVRESGLLVPEPIRCGNAVVSYDLDERAAGARYAFSVACRFARRHRTHLADGETRALLSRALLNGLLLAIGPEGEGRSRRDPRLAHRLLAFLREHDEEPLFAGDVCAGLGMTPTALRRLFRQVLGTTPADYLRRRRLHLARRALRTGEAASVTEAAVRFGFFDFGRFAGSYRTLFGEAPSRTLRATRA